MAQGYNVPVPVGENRSMQTQGPFISLCNRSILFRHVTDTHNESYTIEELHTLQEGQVE